jgi:hypothetical protein
VSEQLREDRIQDVMHTFDWLEGDGYAPVVDQNGRAVVMGVEGPLDLDEFLELGRTRGAARRRPLPPAERDRRGTRATARGLPALARGGWLDEW